MELYQPTSEVITTTSYGPILCDLKCLLCQRCLILRMLWPQPAVELWLALTWWGFGVEVLLETKGSLWIRTVKWHVFLLGKLLSLGGPGFLSLSASQLQDPNDFNFHSKTKLLERESLVVICEDLHGLTPGWSVGGEKSKSTSLLVTKHALFSQTINELAIYKATVSCSP